LDSGTHLMLSVMFGSFGIGYFIYGKKQTMFMPMITGIVLCVFPYFVSNPYLLGGIGIVLMALPFLIRD